VILILIVPLIGIAAKLVGNEKAAAECGYNSIRGLFFMGDHHAGNTAVDEAGNGSGSGDVSSSF
ncbi:MAG: hypothetical protein ACRD5H_09750, partial [Nitrososphaerales archaeon]